MDQLAEQSLAIGQRVHPDKCERPRAGPEHAKEFAEPARFLGAGLRSDGCNGADSNKRLQNAGIVWRRLCSRLSRFQLGRERPGMLFKATVAACLHWGCESRAFTKSDLKRHRGPLNECALGLPRRRRSLMRDEKDDAGCA